MMVQMAQANKDQNAQMLEFMKGMIQKK